MTLHANRDMTVAVKEEGSIETYTAAFLDQDAAAIADAIRQAMEIQTESGNIDFPE